MKNKNWLTCRLHSAFWKLEVNEESEPRTAKLEPRKWLHWIVTILMIPIWIISGFADYVQNDLMKTYSRTSNIKKDYVIDRKARIRIKKYLTGEND